MQGGLRGGAAHVRGHRVLDRRSARGRELMHRDRARRRAAGRWRCATVRGKRAVHAVVTTADHVDVVSQVIELVPRASIHSRVQPVAQVLALGLGTAASRTAEVEDATTALHVERVLDQRDAIVGKTFLLKRLEVLDDQVGVRCCVLLHVIAACLKKLLRRQPKGGRGSRFRWGRGRGARLGQIG